MFASQGGAMYGCDLIFNATDAAAIREEVRSKLGGACPCEQGLRCPLLPDDLGTVLVSSSPVVVRRLERENDVAHDDLAGGRRPA